MLKIVSDIIAWGVSQGVLHQFEVSEHESLLNFLSNVFICRDEKDVRI